MNQPRNDFLTRARLTKHQNLGVSPRRSLNFSTERHNRSTFAKEQR
jgi:hypothetical protein